ncbi:MAG: murein biosynthesis integral membrane protein MurJ [Candidatus Omnitrophota bacterium]
MSFTQKLSQAISILLAANLIRSFLGLATQMLIAAKFGATTGVDAYLVALTIPAFVSDFMFGGVIFFVLIPILTELLTIEDKRQAWNLVSSLIGISVISLAVVTFFYFVFSPGLIKLLAPGFPISTAQLSTKLSRITSPLVIILSLVIISNAVLNAHRRFVTPAIASFVFPLGVITVILLLSKQIGIYSLAFGAIAGGGLQLFIQWIAIRKIKTGNIFYFNANHPALKKVIRLALPVLAVNILFQINYVFIRIFASTLTEGSIAALNFARYPINLVVDFIGATIGTVAFPVMAQQKVDRDWINLKETFFASLRIIIFIGIPLSAALMILARPIIELLFARGEFGPQAVGMTADALFYYSWGLLGFCANVILIRAFYSLQDMVTPLKIGLIGIIINIILGLILKDILGVGGLALAFSIYGTVICLLLAGSLAKKMGIKEKRPIFITFAKTAVASSIMVIILCIIRLPVLITILIGAAVFLVAALILRMDELDMVKRAVLREKVIR